MDHAKLRHFVEKTWDGEIVPTLVEYIRIPNKSPSFDPQWAEHGHMDKAVALLERWARERLKRIPGATLDVLRLPGRTPLIFMDIPGEGGETLLLYGHLDKQPEMTGWTEGTGAWTPVLSGDKLFGRGGADDGYAMFAALTAILALHEQGIERARCVVVIEASEESGSPDLPFYIDHLAERLGTPSLVICLDSGCGNYEQLWLTTSLRGLVIGELTVRMLSEGVHSGDASGLVAAPFRVMRQILSRLEDEETGEIRPKALHAEIPERRVEQAKHAAQILGDAVYSKMPLTPGARPVKHDLAELVLNRTWRPMLAVTGMDGFPHPRDGGNVMLPYCTAKLSLRLPPTLDAAKAEAAVERLLLENPPYGAQVTWQSEGAQSGWNAPFLAPWLKEAVARAGERAFGKPPAYMGEGGSIPFMRMLGEKFPKTQFVVTGVLGPHSNAHGPNEFLHIPTGKRVTMAMADIIAEHYMNGAA